MTHSPVFGADQNDKEVAELLEPGETAGAWITVKIEGEVWPERVKVRLRQAEEGKPGAGWSGLITSPAVGCAAEWPSGIVPCPTYPQRFNFNYNGIFTNDSMPDCDVERFRRATRGLRWVMCVYDAASVRARMEVWLAAEKRVSKRAFFAAVAAVAGSRAGMRELLDELRQVDLETARNSRTALAMALDEPEPPEALVRLGLAVLADHRRVMHGAGYDYNLETMQALTKAVAQSLGWQKCREAVPFLIEQLREKEAASEAVYALWWIGDRRAIEPLLAYFEEGVCERGVGGQHRFRH